MEEYQTHEIDKRITRFSEEIIITETQIYKALCRAIFENVISEVSHRRNEHGNEGNDTKQSLIQHN